MSKEKALKDEFWGPIINEEESNEKLSVVVNGKCYTLNREDSEMLLRGYGGRPLFV